MKTTVLALILVAAVAWPLAGQAAPPPDGDWLTFRTEHFRVTHTPELETLARRAAVAAERTYGVLRDELMPPPDRVIDLVVTDHVDYANGYATAFPSPRMVVFARPPTVMPQLAYTRDWLEGVVAHELVHIFHLQESGWLGHAVRTVFGDVPMLWPVFPVVGSPAWNVEGLATHYETRLTGAGRVAGSFHDMVIRTAALEGEIPDLDEISAPHPGWPGGQRSYGYGSRLMRFIADRYGPAAHHAIIEATGNAVLPTFLVFDPVARAAVGTPFDDIHDAWRRLATDSARSLAARLREEGITATEPVAGPGPLAAAPRVSPDGARLSFAAHDYRSDAATRIVELATGRVRTLAERNEFGTMLGPAAWLPDGSGLVVAQLERDGRYRAYSDLWRLDLDGREHRLTRGLRLAQPDVAPDGRSVVAVQARAGSIRLVIHDLVAGETRELLEAGPGEAYDRPRWSPDGRRIAVARFTGGRVDLAVADVQTGAITAITDDDALDLAPVWSSDGEWVVWWSDRTGIPNLMARRLGRDLEGDIDIDIDIEEGEGEGERVWQVTNVLTGAFDPEISPDGSTIFLSVYHNDGWQIARMPFDPSSWAPAPASVMEYGEGRIALPEAADAASVGGEARGYSAWETLRPYWWLPEWSAVGGTGGELRFLGFRTEGEDLLGRHQWRLSAAVDPGTWRIRSRGAWLYRGLGDLELEVAGSRDWDRVAGFEVSDGVESIYQRSDELSLDAILWRARWRGTGWLRAGTEVEWREYQAHDLTDDGLAAEGYAPLPDLPTVVGVSAGPGYSSAEYEPFSISAEDGVSGSVSVGRWWDLTTGSRAYDEAAGRAAGYLDFPAWGFADHVLAVRVAGLVRNGEAAFARSIGGVPGRLTGVPSYARTLLGGVAGSPWLPIRGFDEGVRRGTRAWAMSAEWRFPLRLADAPGSILGFSLTSISGAVFADVGDAWCTAGQLEREILAHSCADPSESALASAGVELSVDFGAFHDIPGRIRIGLAQPVQGPAPRDPRLYVGFGPAF